MKRFAFVLIIAGAVSVGITYLYYYIYNNADLIIAHGTIVTMDPQRRIIYDGSVAIRGDTILAVGSHADIARHYTAWKTINAEHHAVLPGFINGHTHTAMVLFRGASDDAHLHDWLQNYIFPLEKQYATPEFVYWGTAFGCMEMMQSGITTLVDMYLEEENAARAFDAMGVRAFAGYNIVAEKDLAPTKVFIERWRNHPCITPAVAPHSPYTCSTEVLRACKEISDTYQVPLLIHASETQTEIETIQQRYNNRPVLYLDEIGFLSPRLTIAHAVHVNDEEIALLKQKNVGVAYNPTSNMKLAAGIAPVTKMLSAGLAVGLGTDGAASNNSLSMFEEIKLAALVQKVFMNDARAMNAQTALELATIRGAQAIHREHELGSLEAGKKADIIIVSLGNIHQLPLFHIVSQLVYATKDSDVDTVIINGKIKMRNRKFLYPLHQIHAIYQKIRLFEGKMLQSIKNIEGKEK